MQSKMKRINHIFLIAMVCTLVSIATSCRKMPEDGDLDGQWQVMSIEYVADGTVVNPKGIYYCLFRSVVNLTSREHATQAGNLHYHDRKLTLSMPYSTPDKLAPWGINSAETTFSVKQLSKDKMTLESDYSLIELRKF